MIVQLQANDSRTGKRKIIVQFEARGPMAALRKAANLLDKSFLIYRKIRHTDELVLVTEESKHFMFSIKT